MPSPVADILAYNSPQAIIQRALSGGGRRPVAPYPTPEEEARLAANVGGEEGGSLSGLVKLGNLLDLVPSMARDVATLNNPLDQLLSPFTQENRLSGREVGQKWFGWQPNDPNQWEWEDLGGFGLEVATDPTMWFAGPLRKGLTSGLKAAGKTKLGQKVLWSSPARLARQLFDPTVMGRSTRAVQERTPDIYRAITKRRETAHALGAEYAQIMKKAEILDPKSQLQLRAHLEGHGPMPQGKNALEVVRMVSELKKRREKLLEYSVWTGIAPRRRLKDPAGTEWMHRRPNEAYLQSLFSHEIGPSGRKPLSAGVNPESVARKEFLKGIQGGTQEFENIVTNPYVKQVGIDPSLTKKEKNELLANFLAQRGTVPNRKLTQVIKNQGGQAIKQVKVDQQKALASFLGGLPDEIYDTGLFTNSPIQDFINNEIGVATRAETAMGSMQIIADSLKASGPNIAAGPTVESVMGNLGLSKNAYRRLASMMGVRPTSRAISNLKKVKMSSEIAEDLTALWPKFTGPREAATVGKLWDSFNNLFKVGVLTWPARYVRDIMSGQARNLEMGMWDIRSAVDSHRMLHGKAVVGASQIPAAREWLQKRQLEITDESATDALRNIYAGLGPPNNAQFMDPSGGALMSPAPPKADTLDDLMARTRGQTETSVGGSAKDLAKMATKNPFGQIRGVIKNLKGEVSQGTTAGWAMAGERIGRYTDDMNRLQPLIHQLRKGSLDPSEVMLRINNAQVNYDPRAFTPTEEALKKIFPFYSFTSRQLKFVPKELFLNPGGRLGQTVRGLRLAREDDKPVPEYVAERSAIPVRGPLQSVLGAPPEDTQRYITGLGLMFEDVMPFASTPILEGMSRMNPLIKGTLEAGTGQSFFQRGPLGGRRIEDLDPLLGRLAANITGSEEPYDLGKAQKFIDPALANSPLARMLSTARTLTDPRKRVAPNVPLPGPAALMNVLTGLRVTDISPQRMDAILQQQLNKATLDLPGGRHGEYTYVPEEQYAKMSEADRRLVDEVINPLKRTLAKRRRERKLEKARKNKEN